MKGFSDSRTKSAKAGQGDQILGTRLVHFERERERREREREKRERGRDMYVGETEWSGRKL